VAGPALSPVDPLAAVPGRCYRVGGVVRDTLMGQTPGDTDWVVVGATPQAMLAAGFKPVGRDFPVFLHPVTGDEVALARTERKSGPGYRGFVVQADASVTLEEDLARRDLSINAMAMDDQGRIIDPYGGQKDLQAGVLRHVSPAFVDDPVRLLRVARFAARWPHFVVAPQTLDLMRNMVERGEVDALVPERVWQELSRGLMEQRPSRMLEVLHDSTAAKRLLPKLAMDERRKAVVDLAARRQVPLPVRVACLLHGACESAQRWRMPKDVQDLASGLQREHGVLSQPPGPAESALTLLERCDTWRRPERMQSLLLASQVLRLESAASEVARAWSDVVESALAADSAGAAQDAQARGLAGTAVGTAIRQARLHAVEQALTQQRAGSGQL
jgi:tRNA nucleotidyltransferase (CCA-adding enzyme)